MKKSAYLIPLSLALLTACGGDGATEIDVKDSDSGETTSIRAATDDDEGIAPPENLPAFAPIYPGAKVESTISNTGTEGQGMVMFSVKAKASDIIAFYKEKGEAAALTTTTEANTNGSRMLLMAPSDNENAVGLHLTVMPRDDGSELQQVSLIYASANTP